jgi:uncharacterized membrane protein
MTMRNSLLTLHLVGVAVWLGCGLYDVFLSREIRRRAGTPLELDLIRIQVRYGWVVAAATVLVAMTGVGMSSLVGWGYFAAVWLGLKQSIMLVVLTGMLVMIPMVVEQGRELSSLQAGALATERLRTLCIRCEWCYRAMRLGALAGLVLAVWRPG